ncbi:hypothetical protein [Streptomyces sp. NPDC020141]|uniref:hypothetical protein n=1 Tax=Streptomyces sp. NPDC020141 TaxID=3365065 RepID=UPI0037AD2C3E
MFATVSEVQSITGVSVDNATLLKAQGIIETAAGRNEELITGVSDLLWLKKATAYQCAYMEDDPTSVFEQPNLESATQGDNKMVFGDKDVWLAPLAQRAIGNLSWKKSRSIKTEPFNYRKEVRRQGNETARLRDRWWGFRATNGNEAV